MMNLSDDLHLTYPEPQERLERHVAQLAEHLARRNVYLTYTDHLTDGELFALLVKVVTGRAPEGLVAVDEGTHTILPCLDFDLEIETFLAVYADDAFRAGWAQDWPEDLVPPRRAPAANRDVLLPGPEAAVERELAA